MLRPVRYTDSAWPGYDAAEFRVPHLRQVGERRERRQVPGGEDVDPGELEASVSRTVSVLVVGRDRRDLHRLEPRQLQVAEPAEHVAGDRRPVRRRGRGSVSPVRFSHRS